MKPAKALALIAALLAPTGLGSQAKQRLNFDGVMTKEDQRRTGVVRLTPLERRALEDWIYDFTVKAMRHASNSQSSTSQSPPRAGSSCLHTGKGHWVSKTVDSGRYVILEDDSLWEISPLDRIDTILWLPIEGITIIDSQNPAYPCRLVNRDSDDVVDAKRIK